MYHTSDTNHFKHSIPVVGFWKMVFFFWTPRVGPRTPAVKESFITYYLHVQKLLWKQGCSASTRNPQCLLNTKMHYYLCQYIPQPVQSSSHIHTTHFSNICFSITLPEKYPHKLLLLSCTNQNVWTSCFHFAQSPHSSWVTNCVTWPWICRIHSYQILLYARIFTLNECNLCTHIVASKSSPNLLELLPWIKKYTLTSSSALGIQSEENALKNGEPIVGTSFTTVLQHTGQFWSRISQQWTLWQYCSIPNTLLTWLQLIFYLFPWLKSELKGEHFCDATDIIKNVMEELTQHGFQQCFQCLYSCCGKCIVAQGDSFEVWRLYNCTVLYF